MAEFISIFVLPFPGVPGEVQTELSLPLYLSIWGNTYVQLKVPQLNVTLPV